MKKRMLVPLAEGFEEMEAVILVDVLRRAGIEVVLAGIAGAGPVLGSRGITVVADVDWESASGEPFDAIALPGGLGGTLAMRDDERVVAAVRAFHDSGRTTAALCAAPLVFVRAGLAKGRILTGHPSVHAELTAAGATVKGARVVRDGVLLTSQGPGTAMEFALALAADLVGQEAADEVSVAMCR
jgi:DJ-1 family protein